MRDGLNAERSGLYLTNYVKYFIVEDDFHSRRSRLKRPKHRLKPGKSVQLAVLPSLPAD